MTYRTQLGTAKTKLRLRVREIRCRAMQKLFLHKHRDAAPGTSEWLTLSEIQYGGYRTNIPIAKASPKDPQKTGFLTGGDRMLAHGYAEKYSQHLMPYVQRGNSVVLIEVGVLQGSGLAIWCDLFRNSRIIGLDVDLTHIERNMDTLRKRGAFRYNHPELYEFDQLQDNTAFFKHLLGGGSIDIFIDDGAHYDEAIITTMKSSFHHLAHNFAYFIEDNRRVHSEISRLYPDLMVNNYGELTVVSPSRL